MKTINEVYVPKKRPLQVIQFGEGNFLRGFVDWMIQLADDKGVLNTNVTVIQPTPNGKVKALEKQGGLYTLYLEGIHNNETVREIKVIDVLGNFIDPYRDYQTFLDLAKEDSYQLIISNTTEAGILFNEEDKGYAKTPQSFPGKLLALLYARYLYSGGDIKKGYVILPCELIENNGDALKAVLDRLARFWQLDSGFISWLNEANDFCNTLVDRIVPGYPKTEISALEEMIGYTDPFFVKGEIFHLWVIEGKKRVTTRLPFPEIGINVVFTDDITPYKQRKVRILNGAHTSMVPVAYLAGIDTVREAIEDPLVSSFLKQAVYREIIPASDHILSIKELTQFADDVINRFLNPSIRHELLSIALNSTSKFKARVLPSLLDYEHKFNSLPESLVFSFAATLALFRGVRNNEIYVIREEPQLTELYLKLWNLYDGSMDSVRKMVNEYLSSAYWEMPLHEIPGLSETMALDLYNILNKGMKETLKEVLYGQNNPHSPQ